MNNERDLLQKRASIIEQMKDLHSRADDNGNLSADSQEQWNKMDAEVNSLTEAIQRAQALKKFEAETVSDAEQRQADPRELNVDQRYENIFSRWFRSGGRLEMTPEDRQVLQEIHKRDQVVGTPSAGGYTVPELWADRIIERLKFYGPMLDTTLTNGLVTSGGNKINYPTNDDTSNEGVIIAENTTDIKENFVFGEKIVDAYKLTSRAIQVSHELVEDNAFDVVGYMANMLGKRLGRGANNYLTVGTGTAQPEGIVTAAGIGRTATANNAITRAEIIDLIHSVDRDYRFSPQFRLMMHDTTLAALKKFSIGSADDRPLWQPSMREGEPDRLEGVPYLVNNHMAQLSTGAGSRVLLAADFSEYLVRRVGGIRIKFSEHVAFLNDKYTWVAYLRFDGRLLQPEAAKVLRVNPT